MSISISGMKKSEAAQSFCNKKKRTRIRGSTLIKQRRIAVNPLPFRIAANVLSSSKTYNLLCNIRIMDTPLEIESRLCPWTEFLHCHPVYTVHRAAGSCTERSEFLSLFAERLLNTKMKWTFEAKYFILQHSRFFLTEVDEGDEASYCLRP